MVDRKRHQSNIADMISKTLVLLSYQVNEMPLASSELLADFAGAISSAHRAALLIADSLDPDRPPHLGIKPILDTCPK